MKNLCKLPCSRRVLNIKISCIDRVKVNYKNFHVTFLFKSDNKSKHFHQNK